MFHCHHPIGSEISYKGLLPLVQWKAWEKLTFNCPIWAVKTIAKIAALLTNSHNKRKSLYFFISIDKIHIKSCRLKRNIKGSRFIKLNAISWAGIYRIWFEEISIFTASWKQIFAVILRVSPNICGMNLHTGKEKPKLLLIPLIAAKPVRLIVKYRKEWLNLL